MSVSSVRAQPSYSAGPGVMGMRLNRPNSLYGRNVGALDEKLALA